MNRNRCVICGEILTTSHQCSRRALQHFDREEREKAEKEIDFSQRLEDGFSMAQASQDDIERD